jgi:hypothetical protein
MAGSAGGEVVQFSALLPDRVASSVRSVGRRSGLRGEAGGSGAELWLAEAWAGAAASVGEEVAAHWYCFGVSVVCCMVPPHGVLFGAKSSKEKR